MPRSQSEDECRVLSIGQPWAELILRRRKPFDLRTWKGAFRGTLLIHASQKWNALAARELGIARDEVCHGAIVGFATLKSIEPFTRAQHRLLRKKRATVGSWEPGYYAWELTNVHRIPPVACQGQLNLFRPEASVLRKARRYFALGRKKV